MLTAVLVALTLAVFGSPGRTRVVGTNEQVAWTEQALTDYADVGLDLPALIIDWTCPRPAHLYGFYVVGQAKICVWDAKALWHEIGHAYADATFTDTERADFVAEAGLTTWRGEDLCHDELGSEAVADTLAWWAHRRYPDTRFEFYSQILGLR